MTTDPRLLVQLSLLPSCPMGAPIRVEGMEACYFAVGPMSESSVLVALENDADHPPRRCILRCAYLDLTPPEPPLSRIDGLDVGLTLLGWVSGDPTSVSTAMHGGVDLRIGDDDTGQVLQWKNENVPALRHIQIADPLVFRLAVAAVLQARKAAP